MVDILQETPVCYLQPGLNHRLSSVVGVVRLAIMLLLARAGGRRGRGLKSLPIC